MSPRSASLRRPRPPTRRKGRAGAFFPDVVVTVSSAATPRTIPTDTGQSFAVGVTQRGSSLNASPLLQNLNDFVTYCGARLVTSTLYDAVQTYFAEGGKKLFVSRVFGSGAAQ